MSDGPTVRGATPEDREAVVSYTQNTWPDRGGDYVPQVYDEWMAREGDDQRTVVLEVGGEVVGVCQGVLLSPHEAWAQAMRVAPTHRGEGFSPLLTEAVFDWAADRGATVCRNMVFSWNAAGLGHSRSVGFEPCTEFRWATPDPDHVEPDSGGGFRLVESPAAAWSCFRGSAAADHLRGLALDDGESWALSELSLADLERLADRERVLTLVADGRARATTHRVRTFDRPGDGDDDERYAEYGVGVWTDLPAARALFAAIARDAAAVGADQTRVLVPETVGAVSDVAAAGVGFAEEPDFVLERDLTGW
jgi:GNAT superfamily N-acetyltransferase